MQTIINFFKEIQDLLKNIANAAVDFVTYPLFVLLEALQSLIDIFAKKQEVYDYEDDMDGEQQQQGVTYYPSANETRNDNGRQPIGFKQKNK